MPKVNRSSDIGNKMCEEYNQAVDAAYALRAKSLAQFIYFCLNLKECVEIEDIKRREKLKLIKTS